MRAQACVLSWLTRRGQWCGVLVVLACAALFAGPALAQSDAAPVPLLGSLTKPERGEATAGSELERYLRVLQLDGTVSPYPWTVRAFSHTELEVLAPRRADPWGLMRRDRTNGRLWSLSILRPFIENVYNTSYPFGFNDGAVWAGRGLTTALGGGIVARVGPLTLTLAPMAFSAQNADFPVVDPANPDASPFANAQQSGEIDLPQRFGASRYSRVSLGESGIRLEVVGLAAGLSAASQIWGPAIMSPLVLSNNAEGFPHAYIGSARPWAVGIGRIHGRLEVGRVARSAFARVTPDSGHRLVAGVVGSFQPAGVDGLELGGTRFFHKREHASGPRLDDFLIPFSGFTSSQIDVGAKYNPDDPNYSPSNQLASLFFRWALPANAFEVYGEYMRNDRNADARDLTLEPDHDAAYVLGLQTIVRRGGARGSLTAIRAEVVNAETSHLARVRYQAWPYQHSPLVDGHTNRGQVLGAFAAEQGGGGALLGIDTYDATGRRGLELMRVVRAKSLGEGASLENWDVLYALSGDGVRRLATMELTGRVTVMFEMNRGFGGDQGNLSLALGARCDCGSGRRGGGR